jgi:hypothetical protein
MKDWFTEEDWPTAIVVACLMLIGTVLLAYGIFKELEVAGWLP